MLVFPCSTGAMFQKNTMIWCFFRKCSPLDSSVFLTQKFTQDKVTTYEGLAETALGLLGRIVTALVVNIFLYLGFFTHGYGNSNIFFNPNLGEDGSNWAYFLDGLVQPPTTSSLVLWVLDPFNQGIHQHEIIINSSRWWVLLICDECTFLLVCNNDAFHPCNMFFVLFFLSQLFLLLFIY